MNIAITYAEILASQIVYDRTSGLFPYSPRTHINPLLVEQLRDSITEVGMVQPIIVRGGSLKGIAGNHRLLAYLQWAREQGQGEGEICVPAILVKCDEATAVTIALLENEVREDLTEWEAVRALLQVIKRRPKTAERLFKVDQETARQLEFWPDQMENTEGEGQGYPKGRSRLTREWLSLVNNRLSLHPDLRKFYLSQLRKPAWVNARTIELLDQEITAALLQQGVKFESGISWNSQPTTKCNCNQVAYQELLGQLRSGSNTIALQPDGSIPGCCPFLRLVPHYIKQISSDPLDEVGAKPENSRLQCNRQILDQVEAYCIAPNAKAESSCFHQQELEEILRRVQELEDEGFSAMSPQQLAGMKATGKFTWINPVHDGEPCTPITCKNAEESPCGYALAVQPGSDPRMVCLHSECGRSCQAAEVDHEARLRKIEQQRYQQALEQLCQATTEKTLFLETNGNDPILTSDILEEIGRLLVAEWDTLTMQRIITGWQLEIRARISAELGSGDPACPPVTAEFFHRFGNLAGKPKATTTRAIFYQLRELILAQSDGLERWVACLALARCWRDAVNTIQEIEHNRLLAWKLEINEED